MNEKIIKKMDAGGIFMWVELGLRLFCNDSQMNS